MITHGVESHHGVDHNSNHAAKRAFRVASFMQANKYFSNETLTRKSPNNKTNILTLWARDAPALWRRDDLKCDPCTHAPSLFILGDSFTFLGINGIYFARFEVDRSDYIASFG